MTVTTCLPWHEPQWRALWGGDARLAHALLLRGPAGIGKEAFAHALAQRLLCEQPPADAAAFACGRCPACVWFAAGTHPDLKRVVPEADLEEEEAVEGATESGRSRSTQIRIQQIRELEDFVFIGSHRGQARIVLLRPAEAMNQAAANALLKMLEEPPANVYFIIVSDRWRRLLPTVRSRCRQLAFGRPATAQAQHWLQAKQVDARWLALSGGAPLTALAEHERGRAPQLAQLIADLSQTPADILAQAAYWESALKKEGGWTMEQFVTVLQRWLFDLIAVQRTGRTRYFPDQREALLRLARVAAAEHLIGCYNDLLRWRALASHSLNARLFLEELLSAYQRALRGPAVAA